MYKIELPLDIYNIHIVNLARNEYREFFDIKIRRKINLVELKFNLLNNECYSEKEIINSFLNYCLDASADLVLED